LLIGGAGRHLYIIAGVWLLKRTCNIRVSVFFFLHVVSLCSDVPIIFLIDLSNAFYCEHVILSQPLTQATLNLQDFRLTCCVVSYCTVSRQYACFHYVLSILRFKYFIINSHLPQKYNRRQILQFGSRTF
jgi:hypothetical protein